MVGDGARLGDGRPRVRGARRRRPPGRPARGRSERDLTLLAAYDADAIVGISAVELPLLDNTHAVWVDIDVPPEHRGRGVGAALLAAVEERSREAARTHVLGATFAPPGGESAGSRFAAAHGYAVANTEGFKVLDLAQRPDWAELDERPRGGSAGTAS